MDLSHLLFSALAVIGGIVIHESAHALAAYALGDRTARERGRVSLNPLAHVDPFGTVILPLLMLAAGGPVFAFAKPVPVYLGNLKHPKRDEVLVALAGPASNLVLAGLSALLLRALLGPSAPFAQGLAASGELLAYAVLFLVTAVSVNLSLAFFNLIPLPPLDGSSILVPFLRGGALDAYYRVQSYAMPILIAVLYLLPAVLHVDLLDVYFGATVDPLFNCLMRFALGA